MNANQSIYSDYLATPCSAIASVLRRVFAAYQPWKALEESPDVWKIRAAKELVAALELVAKETYVTNP
jgi:hypothetical protein